MTIITLTTHQLNLPPGKKVLTRREYQQVVKAGQIIAKAKERAQQIEQEAKEHFEAEKKRGFDEGMLESQIEQSEQMLKVVERTINYLTDVEDTMADILLSAVKKVIDGFDDKKLVAGLIKSALQHVRNENQVTVRIAPEQYAHVKDQVNAILAEYKGVGFINPVSDQRLSAGSCILESKIGVIDASIDVQMEALKRRFSKLSEETINAISNSAQGNDDLPAASETIN
ncbi:MAG: HrpE/YscL family type III secretion apparatus protein [Endozoicomonadaceae bacterium]|nr:HrpE/YscL family type III secretion apparatus protein [Endozoicomonadaceae bacterium]MCY4329790.1 HrpE/YscL family type III secretion apparatus protein [Endozoicomonadaceae bacterium]